MMKTVNTRDLKDAALDWAVAMLVSDSTPAIRLHTNGKGATIYLNAGMQQAGIPFQPTRNWNQGGPIIEREIFKLFRNVGGTFTSQVKMRVSYYSPTYDADIGRDEIITCSGPSYLIAAMRSYVASRVGDTIDVPDCLVNL